MSTLKKLLLISSLLISTISLSGCAKVQLFEKHTDPNILVGVKDTELKNKIFYVKDKTTFYPVYLPKKGNAAQSTITLNEARVFATLKDDALIPTHYLDEFVAYASDDISFQSVTLERFLDLGYSIGCYGGKRNADGSIYVSRQNGIVADSSFAASIGSSQAEDIRILSIDGKEITDDQFYQNAGIITGLEQDKEYTVGYYIGTKYQEEKIIADTRLYAAFEIYDYGKDYISDTYNGYMCFKTPTDLKSGYYNINGSGLFRYYNFTKDKPNDNVDMNESYYIDEQSKIEAYSRQYKVNVPKRVKNLKICVSFSLSDDDMTTDDEGTIQGIIFSPDKNRYDMTYDGENQELSISLAEAMAGDWIINIIPKTLAINEVTTESDTAQEEATCEETTFVLPDARENVEFISEYTIYDQKKDENEVTLYGSILAEDGEAYSMEQRSETSEDGTSTRYYIYYEVPYLPAGTYTVRIYHMPEETYINPPIVQDKTEKNTDIIVIEG